MSDLFPSPVTDEGNLNIHTEAGVVVQVVFRDDEGELMDVASKTVKFITDDATEITLTNGTTGVKILTIPQGTLNDYLGKLGKFAVVDATDEIHVLCWEGWLAVRGWE